jgi:hypothetical protein
MHYKIRSISLLILLTHLVTNAVQLKLYNSLPYTLYYAIQEPATNGLTFYAIESYHKIESELKEPHSIEISIVKEIPQAGQDITLHSISIRSPKTLVDLKTYQTTKGNIRLIPQTTIATTQASDKSTISHHDILLTKTSYKPVMLVQEPIQPTSAISEQAKIPHTDPCTPNNGLTQEQSTVLETPTLLIEPISATSPDDQAHLCTSCSNKAAPIDTKNLPSPVHENSEPSSAGI